MGLRRWFGILIWAFPDPCRGIRMNPECLQWSIRSLPIAGPVLLAILLCRPPPLLGFLSPPAAGGGGSGRLADPDGFEGLAQQIGEPPANLVKVVSLAAMASACDPQRAIPGDSVPEPGLECPSPGLPEGLGTAHIQHQADAGPSPIDMLAPGPRGRRGLHAQISRWNDQS